jgi:hypothetical protein
MSGFCRISLLGNAQMEGFVSVSRKVISISFYAVAVLTCFSVTTRASIVASDSAGNSPPYTAGGATTSTEINGLNGGSGFGAWVVTDTENYSGAGATTSSPTGNGFAFVSTTTNDATRNPAPVFDIYDNGNPNSSSATGAALGSSIETATRPFVTPLTGSGSSFSFIESLASLRAASGGNPTSQLGFELLDSSGNVLLNLYVNGGGAGFDVTDANQTGFQLFSTDSGHSGSNSRALTINSGAADTITITLNDDSGDFTITSAGHEGSTFADGGQINMSTGGPAAFAIYDNNGGDGSDIRVNGLTETVVPEPVTLAVGVVGMALLGIRRRRVR